LKQEMPDGFPGATRTVIFPEASGDGIEIGFTFFLPFFEDEAEGFVIFFGGTDFTRGFEGNVEDGLGFGAELGRPLVVDALAISAGVEQFCAFELGEVAGDAGLADAENVLQLSHGEFVFFQDGKNAEPCLIG
jgi:hypothetical protein